MFWIIVIFAIIGAIVYAVWKEDDKSNYSSCSYNNAPSSSESSNVSYSKKDNLEDQMIMYCIGRFCGAIEAIRNANSHRSPIQGGYYSVSVKNGTYVVRGMYDHDANSGVYEALEKGGYLKYLGMQKIEDGFSYEIEGIKPSTNGEIDQIYMSTTGISSKLRERFGQNITITDERAYNDGGAIVSFKFRG